MGARRRVRQGGSCKCIGCMRRRRGAAIVGERRDPTRQRRHVPVFEGDESSSSYWAPKVRSMGRRYASLTKLERYKCRDLFASHAKRIKQSRRQVVRDVKKSYTPRAFPRSIYRPPSAPANVGRPLPDRSSSHAMLDEIYREKRKEEASQRIFQRHCKSLMNL